MNLASLSERSISDLRLASVLCDPAEVQRASWRDVRIEIRRNTSTLNNVRFSNCNFTGCYFGNAKLRLEQCIFEHCRFLDVTFMFGQLRGTMFQHCELRDTYFRSANLRDATFRASKLVAVSFEKADLRGCRFYDVQFQEMEKWGWHGYEGAIIPDEQRFSYFITIDPVTRLRAALQKGEPPVAHERLKRFIEALEQRSFGTGEVMLSHQEWSNELSLQEFVLIGRHLTL